MLHKRNTYLAKSNGTYKEPISRTRSRRPRPLLLKQGRAATLALPSHLTVPLQLPKT